MLIDEVETIWSAIDIGDDWGPFGAKLKHIEDARRAYGFNAAGDVPSAG